LTLEIEIESAAVAFAEKNGWLARKLQWTGRRAAPDRFFARDGRIVLIEFKRPGGEPRKLQWLEINRLKEHGVEVHVIDNVDKAKEVLR